MLPVPSLINEDDNLKSIFNPFVFAKEYLFHSAKVSKTNFIYKYIFHDKLLVAFLAKSTQF